MRLLYRTMNELQLIDKIKRNSNQWSLIKPQQTHC